MKISKIFWIFTISVFVVLLIPALVQDGMFLDGVTYSAISKNLANGIGSFWKPHYTKILYPNFYEHPPLVFGIQSLFFKLLGDGIYTERIYTLLTAVITAIGIVLIWRLYNNQNGFRKYSWLPVLLWISIPIVFWSYKNNLLENTMGIFTIFSIYFISRTLIKGKVIWLIIGSVLIVLAFLSKGFVGLYPMVTVMIYWIVIKPRTKSIMFFYSLITILLPVLLFYTLIILSPGLKENINSYIHQQLLPALNNKREVLTNNHFSIIFNLILELSFPLLLFVIFIISKKVSKKNIQLYNKKVTLFFLLIGLSASLPLMITLKQREFYLVPSIPFFIIGLSIRIVPYLKNILENISTSVLIWIKRASIIIIAFTFVFSIFKFGKYSRDENKLKDVYLLSQNIPDGTIIHTTKEIWQDWSFVAYMCRIGYLNLDCDNEQDYYLLQKDDIITPDLYKKYYNLDLNLKNYIILKRKNAQTDYSSKK
jgi:4-amino-4-deoxy-L-arabinose transferase-like glycosyltransferase